MIDEEIIEDNKLIAEFMGWRPIRNYPQLENNNSIHYEKGEDWLDPYNMKYNISWNWLMPVIEEIGTYKEFKRQLDISIEYFFSRDIHSVWLAVVEFIKWYNNKA